MKKLISSARYLVTVGTFSTLCLFRGYAGEPTSVAGLQAASEAAASAAAAANKLPYGVDDVLKLTRAQVNDDVILSYIQTSGTVYNLRATDVVLLKNQGVSDRIVTAMLDQRRKAAETTAQADSGSQTAQGGAATVAAPAPALAAPVGNETPLFIPGQNAFELAAYSQPMQTEFEAPSTLHVIPNVSSPVYQPVYTFYPGCSSYRPCHSSCYVSPRYCGASTVVRIGGGGHHSYSFRRR